MPSDPNNPIREAFQKAKQDISEIRDSLSQLQSEISSIKESINSIISKPTNQQTDTQHIVSSGNSNYNSIPTHNPTDIQTNSPIFPSNQQENPTNTLNELDIMPQYGLKTSFSRVSSGNGGVPTNKQTNQQTDTQHMISSQNTPSIEKKAHSDSPITKLVRVSEALDSLDSAKKEIYHQIKALTNQEMLVFATIYQLQEEGFTVDYPLIASKLSLSESSIREYSLKLINKGIPLEKIKLNNKKITLKIPETFKKLASLTTILALREL